MVFIYIIRELQSLSVGLDLGNELFKGAYIQPGQGFNFIEDHMASRISANLVSFCKEKIFFEYQALKIYKKKNCESFYYLNRFFDTKENVEKRKKTSKEFYKDTFDIEIDDFGVVFLIKEKVFPKKIAKNKKNTQIMIRHEEIMALILKNIKINAKRSSGKLINKVVQTIWTNYLAIPEKKKILASYTLANLKPISFIHENTAALVYYVFDKKFAENYKENFLIINIGAISTKISLININTERDVRKGKIYYWPILDEIYDYYSEDFSGVLLDDCLSNYALEKYFKENPSQKSSLDLDNLKNRNLLTEIKSAKKTLSVNKETYFQIIDFFGSSSLKVTLIKNDFEEKCSKEFANLNNILLTFKDNLKKLNIEDKIDQIQIIGGTVRVPKVQEIIKEFFNKEIGTNINGDHGPALGASIIAANLTNSLVQKKIYLKRKIKSNIEFNLVYKNGEENLLKKAILFEKETLLGDIKVLSFKNLKNDFQVILSENNVVINDYRIIGLDDFFEHNQNRNFTAYKTLFTFELNQLGIVDLKDVEINLKELIEFKENEEIKYKEKVVKEKLKFLNQLKKNKTILEDKDKLSESLKFLEDLDNYEKIKKEFSSKKNKLESLIYKIKENLKETSLQTFAKKSELEGIRIDVEKEEEEFFSSIDNLNISDLIDKINKLQNLIKPIKTRKQEFEKREEFLKKILEELDLKIRYINIYRSSMYWINQYKFEELLNQLEAFKKNLIILNEKQALRELYEDPIFYLKTIEEEKKKLFNRLRKIFSIRKFSKAENLKKNIVSFYTKYLKDYSYDKFQKNMITMIQKTLGLGMV